MTPTSAARGKRRRRCFWTDRYSCTSEAIGEGIAPDRFRRAEFGERDQQLLRRRRDIGQRQYNVPKLARRSQYREHRRVHHDHTLFGGRVEGTVVSARLDEMDEALEDARRVRLGNAQLVEQLEGQVTSLSITNEVSRAISAVLDLQQLCQVV